MKETYNSFKTDDSSNFALKFKSTILKTRTNLMMKVKNYELYNFNDENDDGYRAFEKFNYRIIYRITETQIVY